MSLLGYFLTVGPSLQRYLERLMDYLNCLLAD